MAAIYGNVRNLSGAILTGLGKVSSYVGRQLASYNDRERWLSARYPAAAATEIGAMIDYVLSSVGAAEQLDSGADALIPSLPGDYPLAQSRYNYMVSAGRHTASGEMAGAQFHSIITSATPLTPEQIKSQTQAAAQAAYDRASHDSPAAIARRQLRTIDVHILSVWTE